MSTIVLEDVCYSVAGNTILKGVNLEVQEGEIVSIMGQSGSGKTTLLKLMTGLRRVTSGKIIIEGTDISCLTENELEKVRLTTGLVFQYAALLDSLTVRDNIVFGIVRHQKRTSKPELDKLVDQLLTEVQLSPEVATQYPSELSGGMQKRVGLARALAMKPSVLFYDEPTSGLDPVTSHAIDTLIVHTRNQREVTSVVVSHQLSSIFRISDRVALLDGGVIRAYGTPAELHASDDPVLQEFLQSDIVPIAQAEERHQNHGS